MGCIKDYSKIGAIPIQEVFLWNFLYRHHHFFKRNHGFTTVSSEREIWNPISDVASAPPLLLNIFTPKTWNPKSRRRVDPLGHCPGCLWVATQPASEPAHSRQRQKRLLKIGTICLWLGLWYHINVMFDSLTILLRKPCACCWFLNIIPIPLWSYTSLQIHGDKSHNFVHFFGHPKPLFFGPFLPY